MRVKGCQRDVVMDAKGGDEEIEGRNPQAHITGLSGKGRGVRPELCRRLHDRHCAQQARQETALSARRSIKQFKSDRLTEQRVRLVHGGVRDPARSVRGGLAEMVHPNAGVNYLAHGSC